jgi:2-dehydro-3-deoxygluconokinase
MLSRTIADEKPRAARFDVICAGETRWRLPEPAGMQLRAGGGAVELAVALAKRGLRVGLATVLADDALGRASIERLAAAGVNTAGVALANRPRGLVLVDGVPDLGPLPSLVEDERPLEVPARWSSQVLLLSGLSPVVARTAALCRAARAARRAGTTVLLDFDASLHAWSHGDSRVIRMLLREVDVARCSHADLAVLGTDVATVRAALRAGAVLVVSDDTGRCVATGRFGELVVERKDPRPRARTGNGSAITARLCAGLLRRPAPGESVESRLRRALGGERGED